MKEIKNGVWPVMITPFTEDNKIDYVAVQRIIDWYASHGVTGIFAVCQSSEMFFLTKEERYELAKYVIDHGHEKGLDVVVSGHVAEKVEDQVEEAQAITGLREPEDMAEAFRGLGLKVLGIKLGSRGCFVTDFTESRRIPAVPGVRVVDTCGAGDSFMAGFLCGMTQGWGPFQSAAFASCVAAKNVQAVGGTAGVPTFDDALGYYHKFYSAN